MLAHLATQKFCDGLPLYRLEDICARDGLRLDRGTMSRWFEDLGASFGATVVAAMEADALANAFCIATDATGFAVQPGSRDGPRRPCRKGHYFARLADRDHILFDYRDRHTSLVVRAMFKDFEGYIQADAASVYDALFRPSDDDDGDGKQRREVGCWSHARRKYWEAAFAKEPVAREALLRIAKLFELDAKLRGKRRPPSQIAKLRDEHLRPLVEEFLAFAEREYERVKDRRGSLRSALGYSVRQADALRAFLDDGRLRMDNNLTEGALRKIVRIRDASLFAGSDDHAEAAGHILSLIASARLHDLDPERYLRDLIRVLPHWPRERFLELSPLHWAATRAGLDPHQLAAELGPLRVPDPDPAGEVLGAERREVQEEVAEVAFRIDRQDRYTGQQGFFEEHDPEARFSGTGHPHQHAVGGQIVGGQMEQGARALAVGVDDAPQVELSLVDRRHGGSVRNAIPTTTPAPGAPVEQVTHGVPGRVARVREGQPRTAAMTAATAAPTARQAAATSQERPLR